MTDLPRVVAESDVGSVASVVVWRKNKYITIKVKLGELPEESFVERKDIDNKKNNQQENEIYLSSLNLSVKNSDNNEGVIVTKMESDSNLLIGDIITEVNREVILNTNDFIVLVKQIQKTGRSSLLLKILRDKKSLWVTIQFVK